MNSGTPSARWASQPAGQVGIQHRQADGALQQGPCGFVAQAAQHPFGHLEGRPAAKCQQQQHPLLRRAVDQALHQGPGGRVDPVHVFDQQAHRRLLVQALRDVRQQVHGALAQALGRDRRGQRRQQLGRQRQQAAQQRDRGVGLRATGHLQLSQRGDLGFEAIAFVDLQPAAQQLDHRLEGAAGMLGRAAACQRAVAGGGQAAAELAHQARLADAGLTAQQQHLAPAGHRRLPVLLQARQLGLAAGEGAQVGPGVEALGALHELLLAQPVDRPAVLEALEGRQPAGQAEAEAVTGDLARGLAHQHLARAGLLLKPGCMVHRRAHRLRLADHHPAGGYADAHLQAQVGQATAQRQRGAQGLGCGILAGRGIAEVAHQAVIALRVVGQAAKALRHLGHPAVVMGQALAVLLVAQGVHQAGGADQVAGQDGDLAQVIDRRRRAPAGRRRRGHRRAGMQRRHLAVAIEPGVGAGQLAGAGLGAGALRRNAEGSATGQGLVEHGQGGGRRAGQRDAAQAGPAGLDHQASQVGARQPFDQQQPGRQRLAGQAGHQLGGRVDRACRGFCASAAW